MPVFGVREQFHESQQRFLRFVGGGECVSGLTEKRTKTRRTVEDIEKLRPSLIDRLRAAHDLDAELYAYAVERFQTMRPTESAHSTARVAIAV
jgi:hypothetical protein